MVDWGSILHISSDYMLLVKVEDVVLLDLLLLQRQLLVKRGRGSGTLESLLALTLDSWTRAKD